MGALNDKIKSFLKADLEDHGLPAAAVEEGALDLELLRDEFSELGRNFDHFLKVTNEVFLIINDLSI